MEKFITAEQKAKIEEEAALEEERKLKEKGDNARDRALDMMMGGVLEIKKEDELKKVCDGLCVSFFPFLLCVYLFVVDVESNLSLEMTLSRKTSPRYPCREQIGDLSKSALMNDTSCQIWKLSNPLSFV